jgi:hypothetical protein
MLRIRRDDSAGGQSMTVLEIFHHPGSRRIEGERMHWERADLDLGQRRDGGERGCVH